MPYYLHFLQDNLNPKSPGPSSEVHDSETFSTEEGICDAKSTNEWDKKEDLLGSTEDNDKEGGLGTNPESPIPTIPTIEELHASDINTSEVMYIFLKNSIRFIK